MSSRARASLIVALGAATWLTAVPARAQTPSSEASVEARREQAKARFQAGSAHYAAGEYRKSVADFLEADRLAASPALSFNIARAYERLSDTSGALRWYRDYLRRSPNANNAAEVRAKVSELSAKLARTGQQQLTVLSMPPGATVVIDGRAVGVTPFTAELSLGKHRVLLDLAGYREAKQEITLTPSAAEDLSVNLSPVPPKGVGPEREREAPVASTRSSAWPWVIGGAGVVGLGGALAFELKRRSEESAARDASSQIAFKEHSDTMNADQTRARILAGIGGALVVGGAVMLVIDRQQPERPKLGLGCTLQGCSAVAKGHF
jgi:tetratricopeptide (TPR) repeat protein